MGHVPIQGALRREVEDVLDDSDWFRALRREDQAKAGSSLDRLIASADLLGYEPGELIIRQGYPSDRFYIMVRGSARVRVGEGKGADAEVGWLRRPSCFLPGADAGEGNPGTHDAAPGKRPRSSMAPTLLYKDGQPVAAFGSPCGTTIINTLRGVILNLVDHGMTLQQAIDAPRVSVVQATANVNCEGGEDFVSPPVGVAAQDALRKLGHAGLGETGSESCKGKFGSVQAVGIDLVTGLVYGAADRRREGTVIRVGARAKNIRNGRRAGTAAIAALAQNRADPTRAAARP